MNKAFLLLSMCLSVTFLGCSSDGGNGANTVACNSSNPAASCHPDFVDWESVPENFNPNIETQEVSISGIETLELNLHGFQKDINLVYSKDQLAGTATLDIYTVRGGKGGPSLSGVSIDKSILRTRITKQGNYRCSLSVENQRITSLDGTCYVRLQLTLPMGAEVEVYNVGQLISQRFFAMKNVDFLEALDQAFGKEKKLEIIDSFLNSHLVVNKTPQLSSQELSTVLGEFSFTDEKFIALRKLHSFVKQREELRTVIEENFTHFDQEEALKIVGLPLV